MSRGLGRKNRLPNGSAHRDQHLEDAMNTLSAAKPGFRPAPVESDDDRFVALAAELGQEFSGRAAEHDLENSFPAENFVRMREQGYLRRIDAPGLLRTG